MLVILAKLTRPEKVGEFALALAITAPVVLLTNLQMRGVQVTDTRREYSFGDYLGLRLTTTSFALIVIAGLVFVGRYGIETASVILVVGLAKAFESISDTVFGLLQQRERMDRIAISGMIKGILSLAALGAGVVLTGSVLWGAVGLAVAWAAVLLSYDIRSATLVVRGAPVAAVGGIFRAKSALSVLRPQWAVGKLTRLVWLAAPLGIVMMLGSLSTNIPRYFIQHNLGSRDLAFFAAMAYLMVAGSIVVNALGQSASPRLAQYYAAGNSGAFRSLLLKLEACIVVIGIAVILASVAAGQQVLTLLYRPEYATHVDVLVLLMVAASISWAGSFLGFGLTAARYFRSQIPWACSTALATVVACAFLVPSHHLLGAALATVCAALTQLVLGVALIVRTIRRIPPKRAS
jgi:O-antigen/teichoic acid export membrane protein